MFQKQMPTFHRIIRNVMECPSGLSLYVLSQENGAILYEFASSRTDLSLTSIFSKSKPSKTPATHYFPSQILPPSFPPSFSFYQPNFLRKLLNIPGLYQWLKISNPIHHLYYFPIMAQQMTTSHGFPVDDNQNSMSAGEYGPLLLQDHHLIDKLAKFDRERIPERMAHAKGSGAHGVFVVTNDITKYCKAKLFEKVGKETPVLARFSTSVGEVGSADTERDPRGLGLKFYTEEGNYDFAGNSLPAFWIRDPMKFPDLVHSRKKDPRTGLKNANYLWDFVSLSPESTHLNVMNFSDRGTPDGYRHLHYYGTHAFRWQNKEGDVHWVKIHIRTLAGIKNFTKEEAKALFSDYDYATRDLVKHIDAGKTAEWEFCIQAIPEKDAPHYKFNILDPTKVVSQKDYPLIKVGKVILNRNVSNHFAESDQAAFNPGNLVPGMSPSNDRVLQGRLFSYPDSQRHRLGANFQMIPVNCPYRAKVFNGIRDGPMNVTTNHGSQPNYEPNSFNNGKNTFSFNEDARYKPYVVTGLVQRFKPNHPNCDFAQPGTLFRKVMCDKMRKNTIGNFVAAMTGVRKDIAERQIKHFFKADPELGDKVAQGLGFPAISSRL